MNNILIVSGHTNLNESFANKTILEEINRTLPEAECVYLDKLYPNFQIDIAAEQKRLVNADVVVLQFPLFWYGKPSIMSRWIEQAFVHGFSHGSTGDKLKGKKLVVSFTSGAPEDMYSYEGPQNYPIEDFLPAPQAICEHVRHGMGGAYIQRRIILRRPSGRGIVKANERKSRCPCGASDRND